MNPERRHINPKKLLIKQKKGRTKRIKVRMELDCVLVRRMELRAKARNHRARPRIQRASQVATGSVDRLHRAARRAPTIR